MPDCFVFMVDDYLATVAGGSGNHLLAGKLPRLGVKFNKYIKAMQCVIGWLASEDNQFC